jgi:autotransporter-associated beta strand protein
MKNNRFLLGAFVAMALISLSRVAMAATHTWTGAAGDGKWSTAGNWSGGAPLAGEATPVVLMFPAADTRRATNDIANLTLDQIQISGDNYIIAATGAGATVTLRSYVWLTSTFFISGANAMLTNFNFTIATNFAPASISVSPGDTATFRCRFTGPGGLIKRAGGTLVLDGNAANTYAGTTDVQGGRVQLSQSGTAIPGDLIIGLPGITNLAAVELLAPNQVGDGADVMVNWNGTFSPSVFNEIIRSITISNANLVAGPGLMLGGSFTSVGTNTVTGTILLGGEDRVFDVTGYLTANCFIGNPSGFAGIFKVGTGTMELQRTNSYNGITTVNGGTLCVAHTGALGTAAVGTQVNDGATLQIKPGLNLPSEALFLLGAGVSGNGALVLGNNAAMNGNIQLSTDAAIGVAGTNDVGIINSQITGAGSLTKVGPGMLRLAGGQHNSFDGAFVAQGILQLAKSQNVNAVDSFLHVGVSNSVEKDARVVWLNHHQLGTAASLYIDRSGEAHMGGFNEAIPSLTLDAAGIETGGGLLALQGSLTTIQNGNFYTRSFIHGGSVDLMTGSRPFNLPIKGDLAISANIVGAGGILLTGGGKLYLTGTNNTYAGQTMIVQGALSLEGPAVRPGSTAAGTVIDTGAELWIQDVKVQGEPLALFGRGESPWHYGAIRYKGTNLWTGPVNLASDSGVSAEGVNPVLEFGGPIAGPGSFEATWNGRVIFSGASDNSFSGGTLVISSTLELNKAAGAVAIPGPLTIGTTNEYASASVRLRGHNQIENSVIPYIRPNGRLDLGAFNDAVGGLESDGGDVVSSGGVVTLLGDIWTRNILQGAFEIIAPVALGGGMRTFHVGADGQPGGLILYQTISDGGTAGGFILNGVSQFGGSSCLLYGSNTFTGPVVVRSGRLAIHNSHGLGSPVSGTTVSNDATLTIATLDGVYDEPLILNGEGLGSRGALEARKLSAHLGSTNTWNGPIVLATNGSYQASITTSESAPFVKNTHLVINGPISGPAGLELSSQGRIIFAGTKANTYAGATTLDTGELLLARTNAIAVPGNFYIYYGDATLANDHQISDEALLYIMEGTLNLSNHTDHVGSLRGEGAVSVGSGTLGVGSTNVSTITIFEGTLTGSGSGTNLIKHGVSRLILTGNNPYTGSTHVQGGLLVINGTNANSSIFITNNATLAGTGTIRSLIVNSGTVSPGTNYQFNGVSHGKLTALGNVTFKAGSKLHIELAGTDAGANHDQFVAGGQFNLAGGALETMLAAGTTTTNDQFVIVKTLYANPAAGTFAGLPEAQIFFPSPARAFQISYAGADGNDITLMQLTAPQPATISGILKLGDGTIQLGGVGNPGLSYAVFANTNLNTTNWVHLGTITADGNGALDFIDNDAANFPMRFYRLALP